MAPTRWYILTYFLTVELASNYIDEWGKSIKSNDIRIPPSLYRQPVVLSSKDGSSTYQEIGS